MAGLQLSGLASGLDTQAIIDQLMAVERQPRTRIEMRQATEQARRSARIALISEVAKVYLALAADQGNLNLARSTLKTQQGVYDLVRQQYEAELTNEIDLQRAQTQVEVARGDVARYTQLVAQDHNALNLLAGTEISGDLLPVDFRFQRQILARQEGEPVTQIFRNSETDCLGPHALLLYRRNGQTVKSRRHNNLKCT